MLRLIVFLPMIFLTGCATTTAPALQTSPDLVPAPVTWSIEKRESVADLIEKMRGYLSETKTAPEPIPPLQLTRAESQMAVEELEAYVRLRFKNLDARDNLRN
ncbi:MAG: hypothetical protein AAF661_05070 [Pseudomonadota bacterium]